jgi:hypothetical protein
MLPVGNFRGNCRETARSYSRFGSVCGWAKCASGTASPALNKEYAWRTA